MVAVVAIGPTTDVPPVVGVCVPIVATAGLQGMYCPAGGVTFGAGCVLVDGAAVAGGDPSFWGAVAAAALIGETTITSAVIESRLYIMRFIKILPSTERGIFCYGCNRPSPMVPHLRRAEIRAQLIGHGIIKSRLTGIRGGGSTH